MLKAEIHVHSKFSDGKDSVEKMVERACELGIDVVSITDHNTVAGSLAALDYVRDENLDIEVIPGIEISTSDGHLLVYGISRDVDSGMSLVETVEVVRKLEGICVVAHPFQFERKGVLKAELLRYADGVEVFNAKYLVGIFNWISRKYAIKYDRALMAGSDAHCIDEMGYGTTLFKDDFYRSVLSKSTEIEGKKLPTLLWIKCSLGRRV